MLLSLLSSDRSTAVRPEPASPARKTIFPRRSKVICLLNSETVGSLAGIGRDARCY
jgi:hypothetical protein